MTYKLEMPKCQRQILNHCSRNLSHQRNYTVAQLPNIASINKIDDKKINNSLQQNNLIFQRYSHYEKKLRTNFDFKEQKKFFKTRMSTFQTICSQQSNPSLILKSKKVEAEKRVPKFIKERQMSKSEPVHNLCGKYSISEAKTSTKEDRVQYLNKPNLLEKTVFQQFQFEESFQFEASQGFEWVVSQQKSSKGKKEKESEWENNFQNQKNPMNSIKSTQSTIRTMSHCLSAKDFFWPSLDQIQQEELNQDFKLLFSSRRHENESFLEEQNEDLTKEFMLLLE